LSGSAPFPGRGKDEIFKSILTREESDLFTKPIWDKISGSAKDFIMRCLSKDSQKRSTASVLLQHRWLIDQVQTEKVDNNI